MGLVIGELESSVLEHLWRHGDGDVKAVHQAIGRRRGIKLNTVQSTMERLYRKGLLARDKVSHAYVYRADVSREELSTRLIVDALEPLAGGEPTVMLSALVDLAEQVGDEGLDQLEALIAQRRQRVEPSGGGGR
jgi:predicted transcriptional regulator